MAANPTNPIEIIRRFISLMEENTHDVPEKWADLLRDAQALFNDPVLRDSAYRVGDTYYATLDSAITGAADFLKNNSMTRVAVYSDISMLAGYVSLATKFESA